MFEDPPHVAGSQFIWRQEDGTLDLSSSWWSDGNYSCDCNRERFLPDELRDREEFPCGDTILIDRIIPFDPSLPTLQLNETSEGKA